LRSKGKNEQATVNEREKGLSRLSENVWDRFRQMKAHLILIIWRNSHGFDEGYMVFFRINNSWSLMNFLELLWNNSGNWVREKIHQSWWQEFGLLESFQAVPPW
jgi:hypothetical protein